MHEVALERASEELASLTSEVEQGADVIFTRNGREVARLLRADEPVPYKSISGGEAVRRLEALQNAVRDHWPDESEFDWKEAIQDGRR